MTIISNNLTNKKEKWYFKIFVTSSREIKSQQAITFNSILLNSKLVNSDQKQNKSNDVGKRQAQQIAIKRTVELGREVAATGCAETCARAGNETVEKNEDPHSRSSSSSYRF